MASAKPRAPAHHPAFGREDLRREFRAVWPFGGVVHRTYRRLASDLARRPDAGARCERRRRAAQEASRSVLSKCACMLAFAPPRTPPAARRAAVRPAAMRLERCAAAPVARASAGARRDAPVVRGRRSVRTRRVVLQVFSL